MIGKYLKDLRLNLAENDATGKYSLRSVAERWGKANSYLSDIENGLIKNPKQDALMELLIKGYDIPFSKAKNLLAKWTINEALIDASDPDKVIQDVIGDNNITININGSGNSVVR